MRKPLTISSFAVSLVFLFALAIAPLSGCSGDDDENVAGPDPSSSASSFLGQACLDDCEDKGYESDFCNTRCDDRQACYAECMDGGFSHELCRDRCTASDRCFDECVRKGGSLEDCQVACPAYND